MTLRKIAPRNEDSTVKLVVTIAVGLRHKDVSEMPTLRSLQGEGSGATITPSLPAVTTAVQATYLTGEPPRQSWHRW